MACPVCRVRPESIDSGSRAAGTAIATGVRAAHRQTADQAFDRRVVYGALAGTISTQGLRQEHRERLGRGEQTLAVLGQQRLHPIEQPRTGEKIKEGIGIAVVGAAANPLLLLRTRTGIRMHEGGFLG